MVLAWQTDEQTDSSKDYEKLIILKTPYLHTGMHTWNFNAKLEFPPTALEHVKTEKTPWWCYGVSWTDDDSILCAMDKQVEIRQAGDLKLDRTLSYPDVEYVFSSVAVGEKLYSQVTSSSGKKYVTHLGTIDNPTQTVLHSEETDNAVKITHLSANKEYLACIDYVNKTLMVFSSTNDTHQFTIPLTDLQIPLGVHLTSDAVLVTDHREGKLYKYALSPSPVRMWVCPGLPNATGISIDESGFIYVTSAYSPNIHIISPEGKKIGELTHEKIKESIDNKHWVHDIAVRNGKMVLACRDTGVMLFNIK